MAIIKRQQHNMKLAQVLNNMLQCGSLVDVTIHCDDGQVNAHKLVLAASSTYFRNLFSRMTNAFQYPIIVLREMPVDDLKTIIQFIYHGEVNVAQNRVDSIMRCANYLQIDGMASSANSLNAILASSATIPSGSSSATALTSSHHQPLLSSITHPLGPSLSSAAANATLMTTTNQAIMGKLHTQYPPNLSNQMTANMPVNTKSTSRRRNVNNSNNNNSNASNNYLIASNSSATHQTTNTSGKPKHTCSVCGKTFTHGFTLKRHMDQLHSSSRTSIFCEICSKSYSCKDSYLRHKKSSGHIQHAEFHHRSIDMNTSR